MLISIIKSELPSEIRWQIARNSKDSLWKIDELLNVIKIEVEAREASEMTKTREDRKSPQASGPSKFRNQPPTLSSLVSQQGESCKSKCVFCRNVHYSASCDVVKDTAKRRNILEPDKRCVNCLRLGDDVKERENPKTCRHCGQRHHQSICSLRDFVSPKPK